MHKSVHLASIGFAVIFGFSFMFSKTALNTISPNALIAYRFLLAFGFFELLRRLKLFTVRFQRQHVQSILFVALLQPVLYFIFETNGLARTLSSEAGMMIALIPIFVAMFSALILKEKPKPLQIFFILLSVSGIMLIQFFKTGNGMRMEWLGFILLLGAVLSAAMFNIASRSASKHLKPHELTYFMMLMGAVVFNGLYISELIITQSLVNYVINFTTMNVIISVVYLGIIASVFGFFLVNYALSHLEAHVASIYANLATIVAIVAGAVILNETLELFHYIGSGMIIIGVYGTVRVNKKKSLVIKHPHKY